MTLAIVIFIVYWEGASHEPSIWCNVCWRLSILTATDGLDFKYWWYFWMLLITASLWTMLHFAVLQCNNHLFISGISSSTFFFSSRTLAILYVIQESKWFGKCSRFTAVSLRLRDVLSYLCSKCKPILSTCFQCHNFILKHYVQSHHYFWSLFDVSEFKQHVKPVAE